MEKWGHWNGWCGIHPVLEICICSIHRMFEWVWLPLFCFVRMQDLFTMSTCQNLDILLQPLHRFWNIGWEKTYESAVHIRLIFLVFMGCCCHLLVCFPIWKYGHPSFRNEAGFTHMQVSMDNYAAHAFLAMSKASFSQLEPHPRSIIKQKIGKRSG